MSHFGGLELNHSSNNTVFCLHGCQSPKNRVSGGLPVHKILQNTNLISISYILYVRYRKSIMPVTRQVCPIIHLCNASVSYAVRYSKAKISRPYQFSYNRSWLYFQTKDKWLQYWLTIFYPNLQVFQKQIHRGLINFPYLVGYFPDKQTVRHFGCTCSKFIIGLILFIDVRAFQYAQANNFACLFWNLCRNNN